MNEAPNILTVYYKHKPGGFCKRLQRKIEAYLENGWIVHYVAVEPFPYNHPNLIPHILPTPMNSYDTVAFWIYFFLVAPVYILFTGLRVRPDLISVFSPIYAAICLPLKWTCHIPMLVFLRTVPNAPDYAYQSSRWATRIEFLLERLGLRFSDRLLANSNAVKNAMIQRHGPAARRIGILTNDIKELSVDKTGRRQDLIREFLLEPDCFILSTSGVLEKRKNQTALLEAFARTRHPRAVFLIIGEGDQHSILKSKARDLGIIDRTIFTGWRKDVENLIQGTDLFLFASSQEGMPNSLLEAMACNIPCLVSGISENTEVISHPEQHFDPRNPADLAEKIDMLIEDGNYYRQISDWTMEDKKQFEFDWEGEILKNAEELLNHST